MKNIFLAATVLGGLLLTGCNPNEDIYNKLDDAQKPFSKQNVPYTINDADYSLAGNKTITANKAFNDSLSAETYVPKILAKKFLALGLNSTVSVTYNYTGKNPSFTDKTVFAYEMDTKDYDAVGGDAAKYDNFSTTALSQTYLPTYLLTLLPNAKANDTTNVTFKFYDGKTTAIVGETYKFTGGSWSFVRGFTPEIIGYALTSADYYQMGGAIASKSNFSAEFPAEKYLPGFLGWKYPVAVSGDIKVLGYKFYGLDGKTKPDGKPSSSTFFNTAKYVFDGSKWTKQANTALYINTPTGWMYDPATRFTMTAPDYKYIFDKDTKHKDDKNGFEYGSSIQYNNISFKAYDWTSTNAKAEFAPNMFEGLSEAQITAKILEQVQKGLILLLQNKYLDAQPIVKGVDSFYFVTFAGYNGTTTSAMTYKFQCTAAGSPATFVFVEEVK